MESEIRELEAYLGQTLHTAARLKPWSGASSLPAYLRNQYAFFEGTVSDVHVLFLKTAQEPAPSVAKKHERVLQTWWSHPIAFAFDQVTPRGRQRMIQEGLAFVVPRSQVYLPYLGVTLRDRYQTRRDDSHSLRPSAQLLLLSVLTGRMPANTPSGFAQRMGYSAMAMGQAIGQLEAAGLMQVKKVGRERHASLVSDPASIWAKAQPLLKSPVARRRYFSNASAHIPDGMLCGLTALASLTMLAEPDVPAIAIHSMRQQALFDALRANELPSANDAELEVEVWAYSPRLLSDGPTVDRLSLYLSLRDDQDDRVRAALEEMMRGVTW